MKSIIFILSSIAFSSLTTSAHGFKCPSASGYFKHKNCLMFWQCANWTPFEMSCAPGTQWDQRLLTCNYLTSCHLQDDNTSSTTENSEPTEESSTDGGNILFKCPSEDGRYSHSDCRKFWQCTNWTGKEVTCSPGTQWDQASLTCNDRATCVVS